MKPKTTVIRKPESPLSSSKHRITYDMKGHQVYYSDAASIFRTGLSELDDANPEVITTVQSVQATNLSHHTARNKMYKTLALRALRFLHQQSTDTDSIEFEVNKTFQIG